ncbi:MFS transporter [Gracilibacillus alcaliphilus]
MTAIWQIGVLLSVNRLIRLPITPVVGLFYRKFSIRTGVLISVACACISTLSYGLVSGFVLLLLARVLWGIAWSFIKLGGMLTVVTFSNENNRGRLMGMYNGLWGLGGLAGMLAGGFLVDQLSIPIVTTTFALASFLIFPLVFIMIPKSNSNKEEEPSNQSQPSHVQDKMTMRHPYIVLIILTGGTMGYITMGVFNSTISPLIEQSYQTEWTIFGAVIGAATLAGLIQAVRWAWDPFFAPVIGAAVDKSKYKQYVIFLPLILGSLAFLIIGRVESMFILLIVVLCFQLISTGFITIIDTLAAEASVQTNPVKMMTFHTVVVDCGAAIGPLVAFFIMDWSGLSAVYYLSAFVMLFVSLLWFIYHYYMRYTKNSHA